MKNSPKTSAYRSIARCALAAAITLVAGLHTEKATATGFPVVDVAALTQREEEFMKELAQWGETAAQYGKEIEQWGKTIAFWQTQLVKLQSLQFQIFQLTQKYEYVAADYGVKELCPGAKMDVVSSLKSSIESALTKAINADGNIADKQNELCVAMVVAENKKYNFTVDYFKQIEAQSSMLVKLEAMRLTIGESTANMTALTGDTTRYQTAIATAKSTWETNLQQQDAEISMLKKQQSVFSHRALEGGPTLIGSIINAAVLEAALTVKK